VEDLDGFLEITATTLQLHRRRTQRQTHNNHRRAGNLDFGPVLLWGDWLTTYGIDLELKLCEPRVMIGSVLVSGNNRRHRSWEEAVDIGLHPIKVMIEAKEVRTWEQ